MIPSNCVILSRVSQIPLKLALSMMTLFYLELTGSMVWESHLLKNISIRLLKKNGLLQLVNFNTRNSNILDLILTNDIKIIISTNQIKYDSHCSDHISILSCLVYPRGINIPISSSPILPIPNYLKSDYYNIQNDLLSIN